MGNVNEPQELDSDGSCSPLYPSISDTEVLDLQASTVEGRSISRLLSTESRGSFQKACNLFLMNSHSLHYFTICSGRAADSPLPGPQDPTKAEAPEFDITASSSRRESSLPLSDFILSASFDLLAVQSPITSDSSDIFHTPDLSGSDIDEGGLFLPHAIPYDFVGTKYPGEMPLDVIWQEALFCTESEDNISLTKNQSAMANGVNSARIVQDVNTLSGQNTNCQNDVRSTSLSTEIHDLLGTLMECPSSAEEEPKLPSNISTEKLDPKLTSPLFVLEKCDESQDRFKCGFEVQSLPRHTPDRPNWALAPDDPPKPQISLTGMAPGNERRRGGRRGRHVREDLKKEGFKHSNLIQSAPRNASPGPCKSDSRNTALGQRLNCVTVGDPVAHRESILRCAGENLAAAAINKCCINQAKTEIDMVVAQKIANKIQNKTDSDGDVLRGSSKDPHCSFDSCPTSSVLHIQDPWPTQALFSYDGPQVPYTSTEFSSWLASLEYGCDKPIVLYQSSPSITAQLSKTESPARSVAQKASTPLKTDITGHSMQRPRISPLPVSYTSPRILDRISWPSLEEEMRFHAIERALSLASKESSPRTVIERVTSDRILECPLVDEPGCLVPVSKIGHAVFVNPPGTSHGTTARVHLPQKISGKNAASLPANHATGALQADISILPVNKVESIRFDAFSWDAIHLPLLAGRGVPDRAGRGSLLARSNPQRQLAPWPSLVRQASQAHVLVQHDIEISDEMNSKYSSHRNISGAKENQSSSRLSPSSDHLVTSMIPTSVQKPRFCSPAHYLETRSASFPRDHLRAPSASGHLTPFFGPLQNNRSFVTSVHDQNGNPIRSVIPANPSNGQTSVYQLQDVMTYEGESDSRSYNSGRA